MTLKLYHWLHTRTHINDKSQFFSSVICRLQYQDDLPLQTIVQDADRRSFITAVREQRLYPVPARTRPELYLQHNVVPVATKEMLYLVCRLQVCGVGAS